MRHVSIRTIFVLIFIALSHAFAEHSVGKNLYPDDFLWGTAIAEYQNSGAFHCSASNWAEWEYTEFDDGTPHIEDGQHSGTACNHWELWREDISLLEDLKLNAFRFALDWSKIEPRQDFFDHEAIEHYEEMVNALLAKGITPFVTLHHFVHPLWFSEKGGFEKEENIHYFVRFCTKMFEKFGNRVRYWVTINEPTVLVLQGYFRGVFPPGKTSFVLGVEVLLNLLKAHVKVYQALKALPHGDTAQIGIAHQYLTYHPYSAFNLIERIPGIFLNSLLNNAVLNFFKTGKFDFGIPIFYKFKYETDEKPFLDFLGLNYYSRVVLRWNYSFKEPLVATHFPGEIPTDMLYALHPQGFYDAIKDCSKLKIPIYITENGMADKKDQHKKDFFRGYLSALETALEDGFDVRGYFLWTLMDNFEWDMGWKMKFGLYETNPETKERTLRSSSHYFISYVDGIAPKIKKYEETKHRPKKQRKNN